MRLFRKNKVRYAIAAYKFKAISGVTEGRAEITVWGKFSLTDYLNLENELRKKFQAESLLITNITWLEGK